MGIRSCMAFIVTRLMQALSVLLAVGLVAFVLFQYVGDPVQNLLGQDAKPEQVARLRSDLGLDQPFYVQYVRFLANALSGDFGLSLRQSQKVSSLIAERLPATVELSLLAMTLALAIGIPIGVHTALKRGKLSSQTLMAIALVGVSLPTFITGIFLLFTFSVKFGVLPSFGRGEVVQLGFWQSGLLSVSGWQHIALPATTLATFQFALIARLVRGEMIDVMRTDYIKFARARGLPNRVIHYHHALKNALVPVGTVVSMQLGGLIAFSIVTESVFQWPGMGLLFIQAVQFADIPVMAAYLCLVGFLMVSSSTLVDLLHFLVDPRQRLARSVAP